MEISNEKSNCNHLAQMHVPYLLVYNTFKGICQEQHAIAESCEDSTTLSKAFRELPRLNQLRVNFCQMLIQDDWLTFYMDRTVTEHSVRHHFEVISNALKAGRGRDFGVFLQTIHLSDLEMPYFSPLRLDPKLQILRVHLCDLLNSASNLRLSGSGSALRLLACIDLDLRHLELCQFTVHQTAFYEFMLSHARSIRSIGCHGVRLIVSNPTAFGIVNLSPEICDRLLSVRSSAICTAAYTCLVCFKEGWRLSKN